MTKILGPGSASASVPGGFCALHGADLRPDVFPGLFPKEESCCVSGSEQKKNHAYLFVSSQILTPPVPASCSSGR